MKTTSRIILAALGLLAMLSAWGSEQDAPDLSDQQEGMRENLADSVVLDEEQDEEQDEGTEKEGSGGGWLPENLRVILPENLLERPALFEVLAPERSEDNA